MVDGSACARVGMRMRPRKMRRSTRESLEGCDVHLRAQASGADRAMPRIFQAWGVYSSDLLHRAEPEAKLWPHPTGIGSNEPHQAIPQHGCFPAEPASVLPGERDCRAEAVDQATGDQDARPMPLSPLCALRSPKRRQKGPQGYLTSRTMSYMGHHEACSSRETVCPKD